MKRTLLLLLAVAWHTSFAAPDLPDERCKSADSGSYNDISACRQSMFERADAELHGIYGQLLSALKHDGPRRKLVMESQRAWVIYRSKSCKFWSDLVTAEVPGCMFDITEQRIKELQHMHGCFVEGGSQC